MTMKEKGKLFCHNRHRLKRTCYVDNIPLNEMSPTSKLSKVKEKFLVPQRRWYSSAVAPAPLPHQRGHFSTLTSGYLFVLMNRRTLHMRTTHFQRRAYTKHERTRPFYGLREWGLVKNSPRAAIGIFFSSSRCLELSRSLFCSALTGFFFLFQSICISFYSTVCTGR